MCVCMAFCDAVKEKGNVGTCLSDFDGSTDSIDLQVLIVFVSGFGCLGDGGLCSEEPGMQKRCDFIFFNPPPSYFNLYYLPDSCSASFSLCSCCFPLEDSREKGRLCQNCVTLIPNLWFWFQSIAWHLISSPLTCITATVVLEAAMRWIVTVVCICRADGFLRKVAPMPVTSCSALSPDGGPTVLKV